MKGKLFIIFITLIFISGCKIWNLFRTGTTEVSIVSVNNNVCKRLYGDVLLYAIFVDTKETTPWSEYDIKSTLDSIKIATDWILKQAKARKKNLRIKILHPNNNGKIPIVLDLPQKTLRASLYTPNLLLGVKSVQKWSDKIASIIGKNLPPDTSKIIATKNNFKDKERLIARLRDEYKTDNVALIYFINNYYKEEISVAIYCNSYTDIEYSVVSFKQPSVIAHEFLHLFGAWDLYYSPFNKKKIEKSRKEFVNKEFPNEIMAYAHRNIDSLEISPFTEYCIGWTNKLDEKYSSMILGQKLKTVKY